MHTTVVPKRVHGLVFSECLPGRTRYSPEAVTGAGVVTITPHHWHRCHTLYNCNPQRMQTTRCQHGRYTMSALRPHMMQSGVALSSPHRLLGLSQISGTASVTCSTASTVCLASRACSRHFLKATSSPALARRSSFVSASLSVGSVQKSELYVLGDSRSTSLSKAASCSS